MLGCWITDSKSRTIEQLWVWINCNAMEFVGTLLINCITNSMNQRHSWKAVVLQLAKKFIAFLWHTKFIFFLHSRPPPVPAEPDESCPKSAAFFYGPFLLCSHLQLDLPVYPCLLNLWWSFQKVWTLCSSKHFVLSFNINWLEHPI